MDVKLRSGYIDFYGRLSLCLSFVTNSRSNVKKQCIHIVVYVQNK